MDFFEFVTTFLSVSTSGFKWFWIGIESWDIHEWIAQDTSDDTILRRKFSDDGFNSFRNWLVLLLNNAFRSDDFVDVRQGGV